MITKHASIDMGIIQPLMKKSPRVELKLTKINANESFFPFQNELERLNKTIALGASIGSTNDSMCSSFWQDMDYRPTTSNQIGFKKPGTHFSAYRDGCNSQLSKRINA
jgi:hypothetical protein